MLNVLGVSAMGVSGTVIANVIRHAPPLSAPWQHLVAGGLGAMLGYKINDWKEQQDQKYETLLARYETRKAREAGFRQ